MHIINWEIFLGEEEVICEPLFCNGNIKENNKPILIKNWLCLDMGYVWIDTYLPKKRIFLSYHVFMHKYNVSMDFFIFRWFHMIVKKYLQKQTRIFREHQRLYARTQKISPLCFSHGLSLYQTAQKNHITSIRHESYGLFYE